MKPIIKFFTTLSPFKLALIITTIMTVLYLFESNYQKSYIKLMDKKWVDIIQKKRGVMPHSDDIVIAAVDAKSIDRFGRWPWSRDIIAKTVKSLNEHYQVGTIGFDIVFSEAQEQDRRLANAYKDELFKTPWIKSEEGQNFLQQIENLRQQFDPDLTLGEELAQWGNVVMGYVFLSFKEEIGHLSQEDILFAHENLSHTAIGLIDGKDEMAQSPFILDELYPEMTIPKIAHPEIMHGFFNVNIDPEDGVVRRIHLVRRSKGEYYPALSLQMLSNYIGEQIILFGDELGVFGIGIGEEFAVYPNQDGSIMLNYKGPATTFKHYSIADIIDRTIPLEKLAGKLVLMGVTEVGVLDMRVTPVSEVYAGVEVHANALDNMITNSYYQTNEMSYLYSIFIIISSGLLIGFILPKIRLLYGTLLFIAIIIVFTLGHQYSVNNLRVWPSYVYTLISMFLVFLTVTQYLFFVSDKDKRFIKGAFQQYLSTAVINHLVDNPEMLALGGEERRMTALFSDVAGFSQISEQLTPKQLVQLLNEYLSEMSDIIMDNGGTVDKFEGDAIIAFFGAPLRYEDHALRAALVSINMEKCLSEIRSNLKLRFGVEFYHRIGINTGPMMVGNMGSRTRFDYTIMGRDVNLAARLEGVNKVYKTSLIMSDVSYKECQHAVESRELDIIRVVGIQTPVKIHEILCSMGELEPHRKKSFEVFAKGLENYRQQNWKEAKEKFSSVLNLIPEDGPSKIFIQRIEEYLKNPPPNDWDGVYQATSK